MFSRSQFNKEYFLKIAKVTPTFETGDKDNISNYCPISVSPVFSKV